MKAYSGAIRLKWKVGGSVGHRVGAMYRQRKSYFPTVAAETGANIGNPVIRVPPASAVFVPNAYIATACSVDKCMLAAVSWKSS
jgi:hypothetical protein